MKLGMTNKDLIPMTSTLTGFTRDMIAPMGVTTLPVIFGEKPKAKTLMIPFTVVELPSTYNVIIGQPSLNKLRVVVSMYHRNMKFPTSARVGEVKSDPRESSQRYLAATNIPKKVKRPPFPNLREPAKPYSRPEPTKEVLEVPLDKDHPKKIVWVRSPLLEDWRVQLIDFLGPNVNVFA
ncbi:hypothetical protein GW17_00030947 [Ensete ventricosum]|nr:hypothetical protein GW17_00030947 [Ensete ventricosum]